MSSFISGYCRDSLLPQRFLSHLVFGLRHTIPNRKDIPKNSLEEIGDVGLWMIEELPRKVWHAATDPRVVTVALTALALIATSLLFYPMHSLYVFQIVWTVGLVPPFWAVKFAAYIYTVELILASACRAEGRFANSTLMKAFYGQL